LLLFSSQLLLVFFSNFHAGIYCWFCCKNVIINFCSDLFFKEITKIKLSFWFYPKK
jgi:hypothetical protein